MLGRTFIRGLDRGLHWDHYVALCPLHVEVGNCLLMCLPYQVNESEMYQGCESVKSERYQ